jgi:hypothetical protein
MLSSIDFRPMKHASIEHLRHSVHALTRIVVGAQVIWRLLRGHKSVIEQRGSVLDPDPSHSRPPGCR